MDLMPSWTHFCLSLIPQTPQTKPAHPSPNLAVATQKRHKAIFRLFMEFSFTLGTKFYKISHYLSFLDLYA
jgi:hypothetical protein